MADITYSFLQHYNIPLDGDMPGIILPGEWYSRVLEDPFGVNAILNNEKYGGAGRFFCHWFMSYYYKNVPSLLQNFIEPINSVYLSTALLKTIVQVAFVWILSIYMSGKKNILDKDVLLSSLLILPLFQTNGYNGFMGIIEKAPTYMVFYSLPLMLLLLFFKPYFSQGFLGNGTPNNVILNRIISILLILILPFSGPLVAPLVILVCCFYAYFKLQDKAFVIPKLFPKKPMLGSLFFFDKILLAIMCVLCIYAFILGKYNVENSSDVSLLSRYSALPAGLFGLFTQKLGFPLLFVSIIANFLLVKRFKMPGHERINFILKVSIIFMVAYVLLLPLGGFRVYRPLVVRHDSMMPVTIILIYLFGLSAFYLIKQIPKHFKSAYALGLAIVLMIFTIADEPRLGQNSCEKEALMVISQSATSPTKIEQECNVVAWSKIKDPIESEASAKLIYDWNITSAVILYYQE
jgi:hypothetical protein